MSADETTDKCAWCVRELQACNCTREELSSMFCFSRKLLKENLIKTFGRIPYDLYFALLDIDRAGQALKQHRWFK